MNSDLDAAAWRQRLQNLLDEQAIAAALYHYCFALDAMDLERLAALFTPDCEVDYGDHPRLKSAGAEQLRKDLARLWRWQRTAHHLANPLVTLTGQDSATSVSSVWAWHEAPDGTSATMFGQYHDDWLRTEQGWRIHRRRQVMTGQDAGFRVPIHPAARQPTPAGWVSPL